MSLDFSKPLYALAPLAGFTDLPFRAVVSKFGVDLTVSEMISANSLVYKSKKTLKMLEKHPLEKNFVIQIAGSDPIIIQKAVEHINSLEGVVGIDLNCGCPAPKVVNNLQGSSLLTDLPKMAKVIETIKKYSNKEFTSVKMRLGFNEKNHLEIAKIVQESGADYLAIHGRTRAGRYKAPVDFNAIKEIKEILKIPIIANGDITSREKALNVLDETKSDGIMIGRGAVGKPWIFQEIKSDSKDVNIKEIILEHFNQMIAHYGEYGAILFRKHLHTYSKDFNEASAFRNRINYISNVDEMQKVIEVFFSQNK